MSTGIMTFNEYSLLQVPILRCIKVETRNTGHVLQYGRVDSTSSYYLNLSSAQKWETTLNKFTLLTGCKVSCFNVTFFGAKQIVVEGYLIHLSKYNIRLAT